MVKDVVAVVAASYPSRGIGYQGQLPWTSLPSDMKQFKRVTTKTQDPSKRNAVVMGRKTWESIPLKFRPLSDRLNVVLTRTSSTIDKHNNNDMVQVSTSLSEALDHLHQNELVETIYVIGGGQVYQQALQLNCVNKIFYTEVALIPKAAQFDTFFPTLDEKEWTKILPNMNEIACDKNKENSATGGVTDSPAPNGFHLDATSGLQYRFVEYCRRNVEELQYLDMCREVIDTGIRRGDRTGTGTLSKFGTQMRFSLRNGRLPLLTTKRTFWRGVAEELLWFISGNTNANALADKDIHIWDGNGSREFLDQRGLSHREVGDLGPVYGFQWRHFGAKYVDMHADYTGQGVDQLRDCLDKIRNNPEDRRIIMSAWNPSDLDLMALPPCHMFCQFYVDTVKNELSCQMYQRSADLGLGVPFNIASYALLTHLMAHVTGRKPGDFVHTIGDAHVYLNHVEALQEQLQREPRDFPTLRINPNKTDIDDFVLDDLEVTGYNPHQPIKMKMAV